MNKKLASIFLALSLIISLVGCSSSGDGKVKEAKPEDFEAVIQEIKDIKNKKLEMSINLTGDSQDIADMIPIVNEIGSGSPLDMLFNYSDRITSGEALKIEYNTDGEISYIKEDVPVANISDFEIYISKDKVYMPFSKILEISNVTVTDAVGNTWMEMASSGLSGEDESNIDNLATISDRIDVQSYIDAVKTGNMDLTVQKSKTSTVYTAKMKNNAIKDICESLTSDQQGVISDKDVSLSFDVYKHNETNNYSIIERVSIGTASSVVTRNIEESNQTLSLPTDVVSEDELQSYITDLYLNGDISDYTLGGFDDDSDYTYDDSDNSGYTYDDNDIEIDPSLTSDKYTTKIGRIKVKLSDIQSSDPNSHYYDTADFRYNESSLSGKYKKFGEIADSKFKNTWNDYKDIINNELDKLGEFDRLSGEVEPSGYIIARSYNKDQTIDYSIHLDNDRYQRVSIEAEINKDNTNAKISKMIKDYIGVDLSESDIESIINFCTGLYNDGNSATYVTIEQTDEIEIVCYIDDYYKSIEVDRIIEV